MTPESWDLCKQIFCQALELPVDERVPLIDRECSDDEELRAHVLKMLAAAADDTSPIDVGAAERLVGSPQLAEPLITGDVVGRYRVLRRIGQGGTSLVYLAEHVGLQSPRRFAIKVIASAFLAHQPQRFDRECDILATFEHPNIARIIDKGVTESGWPYLVLDYIDGMPIHKYCIEKKLAPPEIVRLMLDCCRAVKYIHDNLVAHCDLKPTNILVDSTGSPRILDFGIARLTDPGRRTRGGQTTRGIRPLTPNYASPEQLSGGALTTATDIYSLGVVLYEALTHTLPFDTSDYPSPEVTRRIAEQNPTPPSKVRLTAAAAREDAAFARQLRGDLDSIVLKTLAFEVGKRYASIDALIGDLSRYLAGEVVAARNSTLVDQSRRVMRRRRRELLEVLALACAVGLALIFSAWYMQRRQAERETRDLEALKALVQSVAAPLPGKLPDSLQARSQLAEHTSALLDNVSPRAAQYPELASYLADALVRAADLLGNPYAVNLERADDSRAAYQRAAALIGNRKDVRNIEIRARCWLGIGDTFGTHALRGDPMQAAFWYQKALDEVTPRGTELSHTAAIAHERLGEAYAQLGGDEEARQQSEIARRLLPLETESPNPAESAMRLLFRGAVQPPQTRLATFATAGNLIDKAWHAARPDIRTWNTAIETHLAYGAAELQAGNSRAADQEFAAAQDLANQLLARDPENIQARKQLAVALRRKAWVAAAETRWSESDALRSQAAETLGVAIAGAAAPAVDNLDHACPNAAERVSERQVPSALKPGDLLIANRGAGAGAARVLLFSPVSHQMSVLTEGGYLSDIVDVADRSRTEFYVLDRGLDGSGAVVRLRFHEGHWRQKAVSCGGYLRRPGAIAYQDQHLVLAVPIGNSTGLVAVDTADGHQTLLGQTEAFAVPGRIIPGGASEFYLALMWPGEGGPAEVVQFNTKTRRFALVDEYGLMDHPVGLSVTPGGQLIAGDRMWSGAAGSGQIVRFARNHAQTAVFQSPELSRVTALAATSDRELWYTLASTPFSPSSLNRLDLAKGSREPITRDALLGELRALARVD